MRNFFKGLKTVGIGLAIAGLALLVVPAFALDLGLMILSNGGNNGTAGKLGMDTIELISKCGTKIRDMWKEPNQVSSKVSSVTTHKSSQQSESDSGDSATYGKLFKSPASATNPSDLQNIPQNRDSNYTPS